MKRKICLSKERQNCVLKAMIGRVKSCLLGRSESLTPISKVQSIAALVKGWLAFFFPLLSLKLHIPPPLGCFHMITLFEWRAANADFQGPISFSRLKSRFQSDPLAYAVYCSLHEIPHPTPLSSYEQLVIELYHHESIECPKNLWLDPTLYSIVTPQVPKVSRDSELKIDSFHG